MASARASRTRAASRVVTFSMAARAAPAVAARRPAAAAGPRRRGRRDVRVAPRRASRISSTANRTSAGAETRASTFSSWWRVRRWCPRATSTSSAPAPSRPRHAAACWRRPRAAPARRARGPSTFSAPGRRPPRRGRRRGSRGDLAQAAALDQLIGPACALAGLVNDCAANASTARRARSVPHAASMTRAGVPLRRRAGRGGSGCRRRWRRRPPRAAGTARRSDRGPPSPAPRLQIARVAPGGAQAREAGGSARRRAHAFRPPARLRRAPRLPPARGTRNVRCSSSASAAASSASGSGAAPRMLCRRSSASTASAVSPGALLPVVPRILPPPPPELVAGGAGQARHPRRVAQRAEHDDRIPQRERARCTGQPLTLPVARNRTCRSMSGTTCARCAAAAIAPGSDSSSADERLHLVHALEARRGGAGEALTGR